jgi:uncharacterized protein (DUF58 family)
MIATRLVPPPVAAPAAAVGRAGFGLTPRTLVLLGAGLILIAPAWIDRRAVAGLVIWDLLVVAMVAWNLRRLPAPRELTVTRTWDTTLMHGAPATVTLEVRNLRDAPVSMRISDYAATWLRRDLPELPLVVPARGSNTTAYEVHARERGDASMGGAALRWRDALGLVERWGFAPIEQTVRVYPNLQEGRRQAFYLIRSRQVAIEKRRARRFGAGREFDSLRDHRPGDERRDISWSASARRGKLVTKVYQPERSQTVWLLVDAGRLLRARVGDQAMLDATATAALTLAQVALASGDRVGLLAYGRRLQHRVAPARGAAHLRDIVEALATVKADGVEADHAGAAAAILAAQKRRALIVWLTDVAETAGVPDVIEQALAMAPRHVVLFAVMRQPEVMALAGAAPALPSDLYRVMAAQETLERREALLHGLRQRGALVLEVSPADLAGGLVDRYLEVKERGVL